MSIKLLTTLVVVFLGFYTSFAHGDAHVLIQEINEQLKSDPENPELYFNRGVLYQSHNDFNQAFLDYQKAKELEPGNTFVFHNLAKLCLANDLGVMALHYVNEYIAHHPEDVKGLDTRGKIYRHLGNYESAIQDFNTATQSQQALPEYYYQLTEIMLLKDPEATDDAIALYRRAQAHLGDATAFREGIIQLEWARGTYENALVELDLLIEKSVRKERWLIMKGEMLLDMGNKEEADLVFIQAKEAIEQLSTSKKNTDFIRGLSARIDLATGQY